ncbi:ribonuclease HI [Providencia phage vB_PreS_PR1]|uniref:ribonuclease H n=1 Tax=Providencia phage vB_PreS_PR1 TaxID=1931407 RepID=A0A1S6KV20_9CAUD|nr:Rnase H [Providencia phage vB_PreS_PR1]AQT25261.1 ribonuclease HI [Providencia phage vB_PreS_PR1]
MKTWETPTYQGYTDGGCHGNPGPGGWAWAVFNGDNILTSPLGTECKGWGNDKWTTNNIMEMTAMLELLKVLRTLPLILDVIYTDSMLVKRGIMEWMEGWKGRGWKKAGNKKLENAGLWQEIYTAYHALPNPPRIEWVKAHDTSKGNLFVDALNQSAIADIELENF